MFRNIKSKLVIPAVTLSFAIAACSAGTQTQNSNPSTVDLPQTAAKWQSIGNCWMYAVASWVESIALRDTKTELNISESYITYRYFEEQLKEQYTTELSTGGSWSLAKRLMNTYGVIAEGDFIPSEASLTKSAAQKRAVDFLNESLKAGALKKSRDAATIRKELDAAFGVVLADVESKIINSSDLNISVDKDNKPLSLRYVLNNWKEIGFEYDYQNAPHDKEDVPVTAEKLTPARQETLKRVKRALNAHQPVVMSWFVDFNALDKKGLFSIENLKAAGVSGRQGWHMVVIEDYGVKGVNPANGEEFTFDEGEVSDEQKTLAAEYGDITYFIVKNSWGGSERLDRSSYIREGVGGYHKLMADYLFGWVATVDEESHEFSGITQIVSDFVIPKGF